MAEIDQIRSILESYLRQELDPTRMAEVKELIVTDPDYKSTFTALQSEIQGIRLNHLDQLKSKLQSLEANQKISENNSLLPGDLSQNPTSTSESNGTDELLTTTKRPESTIQDSPPDPQMVQGIRYTTLRDELKKLQAEERKIGGSGEIKKDRHRVVGLRRFWWAVAAGVAGLVLGYFSWYMPKKELDKRYDIYFHPVEYTGEMRGAEDTSMTKELKQAIAWYLHGEYKQANKIFERLDLNKESEEVKFIYLYSLIGERKVKKALSEKSILREAAKSDSITTLISKLIN